LNIVVGGVILTYKITHEPEKTGKQFAETFSDPQKLWKDLKNAAWRATTQPGEGGGFGLNVALTVVPTGVGLANGIRGVAQVGVLNSIRNAGLALAQSARNATSAVRNSVAYVGAYSNALSNAFKNVAFTRQIVCQMANGRQLVNTVFVSADDLANQLQIAFAKAKKAVKNKLDDVAPSTARRAPDLDNYRGRFNAERHAQGKPRLPDDYDAHHRIPEYIDHPDFRDYDFHQPSNIQGVKGSRANVNTHQLITNEWADFRRLNPNATRAQIETFASQIDARYAQHWFQ
jgi:hypothetical protein